MTRQHTPPALEVITLVHVENTVERGREEVVRDG
jgi:hypothetical protein